MVNAVTVSLPKSRIHMKHSIVLRVKKIGKQRDDGSDVTLVFSSRLLEFLRVTKDEDRIFMLW